MGRKLHWSTVAGLKHIIQDEVNRESAYGEVRGLRASLYEDLGALVANIGIRPTRPSCPVLSVVVYDPGQKPITVHASQVYEEVRGESWEFDARSRTEFATGVAELIRDSRQWLKPKGTNGKRTNGDALAKALRRK